MSNDDYHSTDGASSRSDGTDRIGGESETQTSPPSIEATFEPFLTDKGKGRGGSSGNYRSDAKRELNRFLNWYREVYISSEASAEPTVDELDDHVFRSYARYLREKGLAPSTVKTYYAYVSAWCGWAATEGYVQRHWASLKTARDPLPDDDERRPGDQQAWTSNDRKRLTRYVDEQASAAIDGLGRGRRRFNSHERSRARSADLEKGTNSGGLSDEDGGDGNDSTDRADRRYAAIKACRDRALAYVLSYTGVRGAEILRDPGDTRRQGLRWRDVSLEDQSLSVFRKKQQWDEASIPEPVVHPLRMYLKVLDPPGLEWPVFPTFHHPTLASLVQSELADQGLRASAIEVIRDKHSCDFEVCRARNLGPPPSITPNAARRRLQKLCEEAGIDLDDKHGYLAPHGGRRGMGEVMVRAHGHAAAARYLDNSEVMVRQAYQHIEAQEQADMATQALDAMDSRESGSGSSDHE